LMLQRVTLEEDLANLKTLSAIAVR